MLQALLSFFLSLELLFTGALDTVFHVNRYVFSLDTAQLSEQTLPNLASNINVWDMSTQFYSPQKNENADIFEFVRYVQLMQCSGGSYERDLFVDPKDRTVLDDYDFSRLIKNCEGIIKLGAKPHLKLGGVPLKYTSNAEACVFSDNVYPPDDYDVYYRYIFALATALTKAFGTKEVLTWRFGVMTEFENADWFMARSQAPLDSAVEYCKLYDYTVKALQDAIGENVYVGAHAMAVTEGLWDEGIFIRHCANGNNYATGGIGTRLCYLSGSFYDSAIGQPTGGYSLGDTVLHLKQTAEECGLTDLRYGIDEGRLLNGITPGTDEPSLLSRSYGYTWQAAYDARLYGTLMDVGADYFSYWYYLSGGLFEGNPTVSFHVSKLISQYEGSRLVQVTPVKTGKLVKAEVKVYSALDPNNNTLRLFAYNFKNTLNYHRTAETVIKVNAPFLKDGEQTVTLYRVNDNCNWFDEFCEDRKTYGLTDDCFLWSPDDGTVTMFANEEARNIFKNQLEPKYADYCKLIPETVTVQVKDNSFTLSLTVEPNTVVFAEIK